MDDTTTLRAHAKLTLSLRITGTRDDGFHLLDAEMVSLELHDRLTFDPHRTGIDATGPFRDGIALDGSNLVARALEAVDRDAHVTIDKRIPHGGGLGGGSTDAAAALRWADFASDPEQLALAGALGADIPFCIVGGRARVTGIGEQIEPLQHVDQVITLVIPPLRVSTPAAYRAWDRLGGPTAAGPNDLEPAALVVEPALRWWRDEIGDRTGTPPALAGSGATWFLLGDRSSELSGLDRLGATVVITHTVDAGRATGPGTGPGPATRES